MREQEAGPGLRLSSGLKGALMTRALQVLVAVGLGSTSFREACIVLGRAEQTSWTLGAYSFRDQM